MHLIPSGVAIGLEKSNVLDDTFTETGCKNKRTNYRSHSFFFLFSKSGSGPLRRFEKGAPLKRAGFHNSQSEIH
jgi:hypothetical protein